ncbi:VanZ family protein [Cytobacillus depressus]|uniref:VanZ family protein n=1 Tax=Cytobacillus depressus TaxID=1602942 RepID=A0A6L3V1K1_9BACI|nr:VanZ family protein [Cytobacillus depressus]KAB2332068.1 VanZ family protein [Cytobacillus depressus]
MKKVILLSVLFSQVIFFALWPVWLELTNYLHPLVVGIVWFIIYFVTFFIICLLNGTKIRVSKHNIHLFILSYSIGLLILLFFRPNNQHYGAINLIPFDTIRLFLFGNVDFLIAFYNISANIGLFIPFGLYYGYVKNSPTLKQLLFMSIGCVSVIEMMQFISNRGSLDIDDLILNVLGVCFGYIIIPFFQKVVLIKQESIINK